MMRKRIAAFLLCFIALVNLFSFFAYADESEISGKCGSNVSWTLNTETGILTIFGNGRMEDYASYELPPYIKGYVVFIEKVVIEDGVTNIGNRAFSGSQIKEIIIPNTVGEIGESAFEGCTKLESVSNMPCVTKIGRNAFCGCKALSEIALPVNLNSVGDKAFAHSGLREIELPFDIGSIGKEVFAGCNDLEKLSVVEDYGERNYRSVDNCIIDMRTDYLIAGCNASVIPSDGSVKYIEKRAFSQLNGIAELYVPKSVEGIGDEAFFECVNIRSVTMQNAIDYLSPKAFVGCTAIEELKVVGGGGKYISRGNCIIKRLDKKLALGCKTSVIPTDGSVTYIGAYAFYRCDGLKKITIPECVTYIAASSFMDCKGLEEVTLSVNNVGGSAFEGCSMLKNVYFTKELSEISSEAFAHCISLEKIVICAPKDKFMSVKINYDSTLGASGFEIKRHDCVLESINYQMHAMHCGICGEAEQLEVHNGGGFRYVDEAEHSGICKCGFSIVEEHDWVESEWIVEPTEDSQGSRKYYCAVCGSEKVEIMPKLGGGCSSNVMGAPYALLLLVLFALAIIKRCKATQRR